MIRITKQNIAVIEGDFPMTLWVDDRETLEVDSTAHGLSQFIKPGDTVIDAGAYLGDHTVVYLRAAGEHGRVIAVEANPEACECLRHNCPRAEIICATLGSGNRGRLHLESVNRGASYVIPDPSGALSITIDSMALDSLAFVKMDVEGMEFDVVKGGAQTIKRCRPVIMAEFNKGHMRRLGVEESEFIQFMSGMDYQFSFLIPGSQFAPDTNTDVLFTPNDRHLQLPSAR